PGLLVGTPVYMAPEQTRGESGAVGPPADVWALGVLLYECLIGRPPFRGATTLETLEQISTAEPVPPSRANPKVPRDLETICLKCLQKDPQRRYASARDLADDLRRFREHRPIRARPTPWWERAWKWARRRPAVAALTATLVLVVLGALGVLAGLWQQAEAAHDLAETRAIREKDARATAQALAGKERRAREDLETQVHFRTVVQADQRW